MKTLVLSRKAINDLIIFPEVTSESHYNKNLQNPIWPGGNSGITIGLGYDVGHQSPLEIQRDLSGIFTCNEIERMISFAGKKGIICKSYLYHLKDFRVNWFRACQLFYKTSLPKYAKRAADIYPELEELHPYEQTAIVALVYNRGDDLTGDSRREMRELVQAIKDDNDSKMAALLTEMKRIWKGKGLGGVMKRRDLEANYVALLDIPIPECDKLIINV